MEAPEAPTPEADSFREEQLAAWSQFVATVPIHVGVALAYNTGDPVPVGNVELHGYLELGLVARREG